MFKNKKGENNLISIVLVVLVVWFLASGNFGATSQSTGNAGTAGGSAAPSAGAGNTVTVVGAPCTQSTTLTASVVRRYTDVAQTAQNVTIYQNGVLKGTIAHGGTTTVQSGTDGDNLDLYPALDRSTTFYSRHLKGKITTCTGSATTGDSNYFKEVPQSEDLGSGVVIGAGLSFSDAPHKVVQMDTTASSTLFAIVNDGQANQNTGGTGQGTGANLTIGSGGSGSVTITVRAGSKTAIAANGGVLACQFPQAVYKADTPMAWTLGGTRLEATNTKPSSQNFVLIGSNNTVSAFALPAINGEVTPVSTLQGVFYASANNNPAGALDRINCTIFDAERYTRQSDGKVVLDIENRDNNDNLGLGGTGAVVNTNPQPAFEIGVA